MNSEILHKKQFDAVASDDYHAETSTGLSFVKLEKLTIFDATGTRWLARNKNGEIGEVPSGFLKKLSAQFDAVAAYDYQAETPTDLSFVKLEKLTIFDATGNWWLAGNRNGEIGEVSSNFVKKLSAQFDAVATFDYQAEAPTELSFVELEKLTIFDATEDWWIAGNRNGEIGEVPRNHLTKLSAQFDAVATFDYQAETPTELSFVELEKLTIIDATEDWWIASNRNGEIGEVPCNHLTKIPSVKASDSGSNRINDFSQQKQALVIYRALTTCTHNEFQFDAVAVSNFKARESDEISLVKLERITVLDAKDKHKWFAYNSRGEAGYVPSNFVTKHAQLSFLEGDILSVIHNVNEKVFTAKGTFAFNTRSKQRGFLTKIAASNIEQIQENLSFYPGDIITIKPRETTQWWQCSNIRTGQKGLLNAWDIIHSEGNLGFPTYQHGDTLIAKPYAKKSWPVENSRTGEQGQVNQQAIQWYPRDALHMMTSPNAQKASSRLLPDFRGTSKESTDSQLFKTCMAFNGRPGEEGDLPFDEGEILSVTPSTTSYFWLAVNPRTGQHGFVPQSYVITCVSILSEYAEEGNIDECRHFLEAGVDPNELNDDGDAPLHVAAENGESELCELLLQFHADVNLESMDSSTPLHKAAEFGLTGTCKVLLQYKAEVNAIGWDNYTPLQLACEGGHTKTCELLCKYNAISSDGDTALHLAAKGLIQSPDVLTLCTNLIKQAANVEQKNNIGATPLHAAAEYGSAKICQLLLESKANPNVSDTQGRNPLHWATQNMNMSDVYHALIKGGADINKKDNDGNTVLHLAAMKAQQNPNALWICMYLIENGANVKDVNKAGNTALHLMLSEETPKIDETRCASKPLQKLMLPGENEEKLKLCQYLIENGVDISAKNKNGYTALHMAVMNEVSQDIKLCKLLLDSGIDVMEKDNEGNTALHLAAMTIPFYTTALPLCIYLIENGADPMEKNLNKNGERPLDILPKYDPNVQQAVYKAKQRAKYSELMKTGTQPIEVVKLFLCGAPAAGKTTIKKSLTQELTKHSDGNAQKPNDEPYVATPGIDVSKHTITDTGVFCIWDCAGHIEYHVSHAMFLGVENSIFLMVYNLLKATHPEDIHYWLSFVKSGNRRGHSTKPQVVMVATHIDKVQDKRMGKIVAKKNLEKAHTLFGNSLDISDVVITLDGRVASEDGFIQVKSTLKELSDHIRGTRMLPTICQMIMDKGRSWCDPIHPVLPWQLFYLNVKEIASKQIKKIESILEEEAIHTVASYLNDMGEIYLASMGENEEDTMVVMDVHWLCYKVIGRVFAGGEFPAYFQKLPEKPLYEEQELEEYLEAEGDANFQLAIYLLEHLKLVFQTKDNKYLIPAKLSPTLAALNFTKRSEFTEAYGIQLQCAGETDVFAPDLFPRLQVSMWEEFQTSTNKANYSQTAIKFTVRSIEGMLQQTSRPRAISIAVMCRGIKDRSACHYQLQRISRMIELELMHCSPGTVTKQCYLSPSSLMECSDLSGVLCYGQEDLLMAEDGDGFVRHSKQAYTDKMEKVICQGVNTMFLNKLGPKCGWEWVPLSVQQELYSLLDKIHPLGGDFRAVAEAFGISEEQTQHIKEACCTRNHSVTGEIIQQVCASRRENKQKLTIGEVLSLLQHPGIVDNDQAVSVIENMLKEYGYPGRHELVKIKTDVPVVILLWRAVLRQIHQTLRQNIVPSDMVGFLADFISEDDEEEIMECEGTKRTRYRKAADLLCYKLIRVKKPGWHEPFMKALRSEAQHMIGTILDVHNKLLSHPLFSSLQEKEYNLP